jgi:hypothetical protein
MWFVKKFTFIHEEIILSFEGEENAQKIYDDN